MSPEAREQMIRAILDTNEWLGWDEAEAALKAVLSSPVMVDLVEEVARAICRAEGMPVDVWWRSYREHAAKAIEVIRKHGGPLPVYSSLDEIPDSVDKNRLIFGFGCAGAFGSKLS